MRGCHSRRRKCRGTLISLSFGFGSHNKESLDDFVMGLLMAKFWRSSHLPTTILPGHPINDVSRGPFGVLSGGLEFCLLIFLKFLEQSVRSSGTLSEWGNSFVSKISGLISQA